jgi:hypothetical protein
MSVPNFEDCTIGQVVKGNVVHIYPTRPPRPRIVIQPGPDCIDDAQKLRLRELVAEVVRLETMLRSTPKRHAAVWGALTAKARVTSYHLIPAALFARAEAYLLTWGARLRALEAAPAKDPDWRNAKYRFIHAAAKEADRATDLPRLLVERYSGRSLKDLSSLELESVYRIVDSWKRVARRAGAL